MGFNSAFKGLTNAAYYCLFYLSVLSVQQVYSDWLFQTGFVLWFKICKNDAQYYTYYRVLNRNQYYIVVSHLWLLHVLRPLVGHHQGNIYRGITTIIFNYALQPSRVIVRSGLDVPTFATRRLHACHHARAPTGGRWNCGREMSRKFCLICRITRYI